jgi:PAS domain S-box-containing protein
MHFDELTEKDLLKACMEDAKVGMCVLDELGTVLFMNSIMTAHLRLKNFDFSGQSVLAMLKNVVAPKHSNWWMQQAKSSAILIEVTEHQGRNAHILVKSRAVNTANQRRYKLITATDITEVQDANHDVEIWQQRWRSMNAGVVIVSAKTLDMPILFVNPKFEEMTGYASVEILGRNCRFLQNNDHDQAGIKDIRFAITRGLNAHVVIRNYRKDGSMFMNELFISPIRDEQGQIIQYMSVQHLQSSS